MRIAYRFVFCAIAFLSVALSPCSSQASLVLGAKVIVESDGEVIAKFLGHTAAFSNDLYLDAPANGLGIIFNNHTTPVGTTVSLGTFTAGTELEFRIHVNDTGYDYYTGPASRNPDGLFHAGVDDMFSATETYVGFEDLFGGGDLDYDDLKFSFTNVMGVEADEVAEPVSLAIWGFFATGAGAVLLRKRSRRREVSRAIVGQASRA